MPCKTIAPPCLRRCGNLNESGALNEIAGEKRGERQEAATTEESEKKNEQRERVRWRVRLQAERCFRCFRLRREKNRKRRSSRPVLQSRKPVFTSFSRKNFTSPSSESLMPIDFNIPRSPFSTAINTERRCSRSDRSRCNAAPKSSIV